MTMKLALHRSIIFWSGLLVMGFLAWGWWDSERNWTGLGRNGLSVSNHWSGIRLEFQNEGRAKPPVFERIAYSIHFNHTPEGIVGPYFVRPTDWMGAEREKLQEKLYPDDEPVSSFGVYDYLAMSMVIAEPGSWTLFIPYWLILLTVAALWLALLFWRARRCKRSITP